MNWKDWFFRINGVASVVLVTTVLTTCGGSSSKGPQAKGANAPILLFNGSGTSPNDVFAIESILSEGHLNYSRVNSLQLNEMSEAKLRLYRLLIVPGGNFVDIGNGLTTRTTRNIRTAVDSGLNYLGICAGGFFAGNSPYNGLNLTSGVKFRFYSIEDRGIRKAAVPITDAAGATLEHYWEDGPHFTGWGAIIGKYPDGTPAIVEGAFGGGWVVLSGVHPEAPAGWRQGMIFNTPVSADRAYAGTLIRAALNRVSLTFDSRQEL